MNVDFRSAGAMDRVFAAQEAFLAEVGADPAAHELFKETSLRDDGYEETLTVVPAADVPAAVAMDRTQRMLRYPFRVFSIPFRRGGPTDDR